MDELIKFTKLSNIHYHLAIEKKYFKNTLPKDIREAILRNNKPFFLGKKKKKNNLPIKKGECADLNLPNNQCPLITNIKEYFQLF